MIGWRKGNVGWSTNKPLDWRMDDVGLCLGFLAGDESAERGRRRGRRGRRKRREKVPTYNYLCNQSIRRLDLAAMYICNVNLFWFFPTSPPPRQPKPPPPFSSVPFKGCSKFPSSNSKKKKIKKKMYRVVSCRVANARVGYRIKCLSKV